MSTTSLTHGHLIRVYYEDTDAAGVVYYANYLKFIERGRTEWLRDCGFELPVVEQQHGVVFVVRDINARYRRPAKLGDALTVKTRLMRYRKASFELEQSVWNQDLLLFECTVTLACVNNTGLIPKPIPDPIRKILEKWKTP